jgi:hypothetical protein
MAQTLAVTPITGVFGSKIIQITSSGGGTGTADENVNSGATTVYMVDITNANSGDVFVRFFNATSITYGTTVPDVTIMVPGSTQRQWAVPGGWVFGTGLSVGVTTSATHTVVTRPASTVTVSILMS